MSASGRYEKLATERELYLDRARECAELTIPSLLPYEGFSYSNDLYQPYQSVGSRGVNNLASKLLLLLFPPNSPFFRLSVDSETKKELVNQPGLKTKIEETLANIEREIQAEVESSALRVPIYEALKHLIVAGNVLLHLPKKGSLRVFPLHSFGVKRDPQGEILEIIVKEMVSPMSLDEEIRQQADIKNQDEDVEVFTVVRKDGDFYNVQQEVKDVIIPKSQGRYKKELLPFIPLRMVRIDNEDYGRSYCEEFIGDLKSLEGLTEAMVEAAAATSKVVFLVRPNATTRKRDIAEAENGAVITGQPDDVRVLQTEKRADMQVSLQAITRIEERLAFDFLLNSAIQRKAERVTAEEIRYMAQELETALGGVYSILSQEMQLPIVNILMQRMSASGKIPKIPKDKVAPVIITGIEALGRGNDLNKLRTFMTDVIQLAQANPETIQRVDFGDLITRLATGHGIDTSGLIKTDEQLAAEVQQQQQAMQQQMLNSAMEKAAPGAVKEYAKASAQNLQQQQQQQGTTNETE